MISQGDRPLVTCGISDLLAPNVLGNLRIQLDSMNQLVWSAADIPVICFFLVEASAAASVIHEMC